MLEVLDEVDELEVPLVAEVVDELDCVGAPMLVELLIEVAAETAVEDEEVWTELELVGPLASST